MGEAGGAWGGPGELRGVRWAKRRRVEDVWGGGGGPAGPHLLPLLAVKRNRWGLLSAYAVGQGLKVRWPAVSGPPGRRPVLQILPNLENELVAVDAGTGRLQLEPPRPTETEEGADGDGEEGEAGATATAAGVADASAARNPDEGTGWGMGKEGDERECAMVAAAAAKDLAAVEAALAQGCDVNAYDKAGRTVLSHLVKDQSLPVVRRFLDRGADPWVYDYESLTPTMVAAGAGNVEVLRHLVEELELDVFAVTTGDGPASNALRAAVLGGHAEAADVLIDAGADVNQQDEATGDHLLLDAARAGHAGVVRLLLQAGAKVNRTDRRGWTALTAAAAGGHARVVRALLREENVKAIPTFDGKLSPLMAAAGRAGDAATSVKVIDRLLKRAARAGELPGGVKSPWHPLYRVAAEPGRPPRDEGWAPAWWAPRVGARGFENMFSVYFRARCEEFDATLTARPADGWAAVWDAHSRLLVLVEERLQPLADPASLLARDWEAEVRLWAEARQAAFAFETNHEVLAQFAAFFPPMQ